MPDEKREMLPVVVPDDDFEVIDIEREIEAAVAEARVRLATLQRITEVSLLRTYKHDWVNFPKKDESGKEIGRPYLTAAGALRIRELFGISIKNVDLKRYQQPDGAFMYVCTGEAHRRNDVLAVMGTCKSNSQFYSTRYEYVDGKRNRVQLSPEEVDEVNIAKKARTDMIRTAVVDMLGLRDLTWELLEGYGFKREEASVVRFEDRKQEKPATTTVVSRKQEPTKPAAPTVSAPSNGAAPPDGKSWYTSLMGEIAKQAGGSVNSPKGLEILRTLTAFTPKATPEKPNPPPFPGFQSWEQLERSKNCERAALIAYKRFMTPVPSSEPITAPADVPQEGLGI